MARVASPDRAAALAARKGQLRPALNEADPLALGRSAGEMFQALGQSPHGRERANQTRVVPTAHLCLAPLCPSLETTQVELPTVQA